MPVFLKALALKNYRGIGPEVQRMPHFKEFNFFIGANNAGKSTVLNFISKYLSSYNGSGQLPRPEYLERYSGQNSGPPTMAIGVPLQEFYKHAIEKVPEINRPRFEAPLKAVCTALADDGTVWFSRLLEGADKHSLSTKPDPGLFRSIMPESEWSLLWRLTSQYASGGGYESDWLPHGMNLITGGQLPALPKVNLIPAIRQIGKTGNVFQDFSGTGLIDRLAELQSPDHDKRHETRIFERINAFLSNVTGHEGAKIEIPHNRDHILVHIDGKVLPLSSLGTGIHEVIMIAAFCTISEKQIMCIEEPELHLHPLLQRKLVKYLKDNTSNQYFIATHSPSFIDTPHAAIFHVSIERAQTTIRESVLKSQKYAICLDLGHRASDLIQANSVIWVEGPSDRIYLVHWIGHVAPDLIEGIHYSVMFYGGRMLSHLSANDDDVSEFISLRSLNQNCAIVIDSDKASRSAPVNDTKKRLASEFASGRGVAWITRGREIENYIDHGRLQTAVKTVHSGTYARPLSGGLYDHALYFERLKPKRNRGAGKPVDLVERDVDKVKVARQVCKSPADLGILDLKDRVREIVNMIRAANA